MGESGCGKSTIAKLVQRFYDPTGGKILLDGVDLKELSLKDLRSNIGVVSQEPLLFDKSVLENIRYGKPEATDAEVEAAAKNANAHGFISNFPDGYNTKVGPKGGKLSGGQKQRVAIARALLRDPPILILDEATSALDSKSEKVVQRTLDQLVQNKGKGGKARTTIVIAHRMSTIRNADHICVLGSPDGMTTAATGSIILEEGNHDKLMSLESGFYKALIMAGTRKGESSTSGKNLDTSPSQQQLLLEGSISPTSDDTDTDTEMAMSIASTTTTAAEEGKSLWQRLTGKKNPEQAAKDGKEKEDYKRQKSRIWQYTKPDIHWILFGTCASAIKGTSKPRVLLLLSCLVPRVQLVCPVCHVYFTLTFVYVHFLLVQFFLCYRWCFLP